MFDALDERLRSVFEVPVEIICPQMRRSMARLRNSSSTRAIVIGASLSSCNFLR